MKYAWLKRRIYDYYLIKGLFALAVSLLLTPISLAQLADTRIAFESTRSRHWIAEIYMMDPDGGQIQQLTDEPKYDGAPAWSPDGKRITFVSYRDLKQIPERGVIRGEIYVMNADGTNLINLTRSVDRAERVSTWSPDGKQIAFTSAELFNGHTLVNSDIFVMDVDGGDSINLTNHDALDQTPDWSPDGNRIAFSSLRDGNWEIYLINADGTNPINITNHPAKDGRPDWSPDGQQIAFTSDRDGNLEIYIMNADGTNPINLTNHPAEDNRSSWSPDGTRIAFDSNRDDPFGEIYVMKADGTNPINITQNPDDWDLSPSWGPAPALSVASNGKLATVWGKVKRPNTYTMK
ncbi:PD40 domain-containing protein [Candidatus Poribacteria bacterium]|nr:PD40 domain-containing protein [Candidatus Poribacteria bacterium]